jgi:hypothetical protein
MIQIYETFFIYPSLFNFFLTKHSI